MTYLSQYKIDETPLGEGGMGRIFRAYTPDGQVVAIKEILPQYAADAEMRYRLDRERKLLDRMENPSIVRTYESFMLDDKYYIVMELVEGMNLEKSMATYGRYTLEQAVPVMCKVLEVMQYVHEQGIVHRDLKPSNIMLRPDGSVCLLDFGIAKDLNNKSEHTVIGSIIGSDGYMSPEQAIGTDIDCRSDIYSLGCVFYYMLTGHHAFPPVESDSLMLNAVLNEPFPRLNKYLEDDLPEAQKVIDKATEKNMLHRFQHCLEFNNALRQLIGLSPIVPELADAEAITIGRKDPENPGVCDIEFDHPTVSAKHATVELKNFSNGTYFIYHDTSTNGTVINGNMVHRMAFHHKMSEPDPEVYLCNDPNLRLDWKLVKKILLERSKKKAKSESEAAAEQKPEKQPVHGGTRKGKIDVDAPLQPIKPEGNSRIWRIVLAILLLMIGTALIMTAILLRNDIILQAGAAGLGAGLITVGFLLFKK